jgi:hypothetical protein
LETCRRFAPPDATNDASAARWGCSTFTATRRVRTRPARPALPQSERSRRYRRRAQLAHRLYPGRGGAACPAGVAGSRRGAHLRRDRPSDIADERGHEAARRGTAVENNRGGRRVPSSQPTTWIATAAHRLQAQLDPALCGRRIVAYCAFISSRS